MGLASDFLHWDSHCHSWELVAYWVVVVSWLKSFLPLLFRPLLLLLGVTLLQEPIRHHILLLLKNLIVSFTQFGPRVRNFRYDALVFIVLKN